MNMPSKELSERNFRGIYEFQKQSIMLQSNLLPMAFNVLLHYGGGGGGRAQSIAQETRLTSFD